MAAGVSSCRVTGEQFEWAKKVLSDFVEIPSVSNPHSPDYSEANLQRGADFVGGHLKDLGLQVELFRIEGSPPFVLAEKVVDVAKPTILLYAHYDKQPVDPEKWKSKPFVMEEREGRLYGRGACDDGGGVISILTALKIYKDAGKPFPVNVKVLFEGEEEYGSSHMAALFKQRAQKLSADALVVLDAVARDVDTGTLTSSTRGLANITVVVKALEKPFHSGLGVLAPDPAMALAQLVASVANPRMIPGFMDGWSDLGAEEREVLRRESKTAEDHARELGALGGAAALRLGKGKSVAEGIVEEPNISIVNMTAGKFGGGNSVQDKATATVSIRVLPGQDPVKVGDSVVAYLKRQKVSPGMQIEIIRVETACGWKGDLTGKFTKKYFEALAEAFSKTCALPCGGALPLLEEFRKASPKTEIIVPGVEDPATGAHGPDESQDIGLLRRTIDTVTSFLEKAGQ